MEDIRVARFGSKVGQIGSKWHNSGTFPHKCLLDNSISVINKINIFSTYNTYYPKPLHSAPYSFRAQYCSKSTSCCCLLIYDHDTTVLITEPFRSMSKMYFGKGWWLKLVFTSFTAFINVWFFIVILEKIRIWLYYIAKKVRDFHIPSLSYQASDLAAGSRRPSCLVWQTGSRRDMKTWDARGRACCGAAVHSVGHPTGKVRAP